MELYLKVVESDKATMCDQFNQKKQQQFQATLEAEETPFFSDKSESIEQTTSAISHVQPLQIPRDLPSHTRFESLLSPGWHKITAPVKYAYGGKMSYITQDVMMFPLAEADGLIDLVMVDPVNFLQSVQVSNDPVAVSSSDFESSGREWVGAMRCFRYEALSLLQGGGL